MVAAVAISGKRGVGKDTLADLLMARGPFTRVAFADESKAMLAEAHPEVDLARLREDRGYKEEWRPALTALTERALALDPLVFVKRALAGGEGPLLVVDLRLRVELEYLRANTQLFLVRVACAPDARRARGWVPDPVKDAHFTETELDDEDFDLVVDNSGPLAELEPQADAVLSAFTTRAAT